MNLILINSNYVLKQTYGVIKSALEMRLIFSRIRP